MAINGHQYYYCPHSHVGVHTCTSVKLMHCTEDANVVLYVHVLTCTLFVHVATCTYMYMCMYTNRAGVYTMYMYNNIPDGDRHVIHHNRSLIQSLA